MDEQKKYETEIDFKSLPKSPSRLFGWIFPYYLILFLIVGIYFVKHMNEAAFNNVPANYTDSLDVNVNVETKLGGVMPAIDLSIISEPSSDLIEQGKALYITNCASCHGNDGKGDGVAAAALNPAPRNFHSADGWTNGRDFTAMFNTLQKGVPGTGMIAYEFLPAQDRIAMIQYIRTFEEFPIVSESEIASLDNTYELSKGVIAPNNVSLETAAAKISEEAAKIVSDVEIVLDKLKSMDSESVELFNSVVKDKNKVIAIFIRDFSKKLNSDGFITRIVNFPNESGFKSDVSLLSQDKLNEIFQLLNKVTG